jgi:hypothetical protein
MTDPGCQRITHLQYLLRGDAIFPEEAGSLSANTPQIRLAAVLVGI